MQSYHVWQDKGISVRLQICRDKGQDQEAIRNMDHRFQEIEFKRKSAKEGVKVNRFEIIEVIIMYSTLADSLMDRLVFSLKVGFNQKLKRQAVVVLGEPQARVIVRIQ